MKRLIALAGRAGSGKNTVASILGGKEISFAEPLKRFCQEVFAFTDEQVWGPSSERNKPDGRYPREHGPWRSSGGRCRRACCSGACSCCGTLTHEMHEGKTACFLTPRLALQHLGTEFGRAMYENTWADLGVRRALACPDDLVLITDCRFVNESKAVLRAGGEVWRVVRPGAGLSGAASLHPSEAEQESPEFLRLVTRTVDNSGTLAELACLVSDLGSGIYATYRLTSSDR